MSKEAFPPSQPTSIRLNSDSPMASSAQEVITQEEARRLRSWELLAERVTPNDMAAMGHLLYNVIFHGAEAIIYPRKGAMIEAWQDVRIVPTDSGRVLAESVAAKNGMNEQLLTETFDIVSREVAEQLIPGKLDRFREIQEAFKDKSARGKRRSWWLNEVMDHMIESVEALQRVVEHGVDAPIADHYRVVEGGLGYLGDHPGYGTWAQRMPIQPPSRTPQSSQEP